MFLSILQVICTNKLRAVTAYTRPTVSHVRLCIVRPTAHSVDSVSIKKREVQNLIIREVKVELRGGRV